MNVEEQQEQQQQQQQQSQQSQQSQHQQLDQQLFNQQLIDRMDTIERKLDLILQKLDDSVIKNCDKMGTHIDFVNGVYATVKVPLNYISNKIHRLANPLRSPTDLPLINN